MDPFPHVNQFTSILPYEIVEYIFLLCCTPLKWDGYLYDRHLPATSIPLLLSHVCKIWREIVHATPALWTDVCVHGRSSHPEILRQSLRYSQTCPLTACVVIGAPDVDCIEWIDTCIRELFCHSDRIYSFRLHVEHSARLWGEGVSVPSFPCLREVKLRLSHLSPVGRLSPLF
ncbi:hypothetical protein BJ138DRAFT_811068 [Hygrophoropsis aurantiaca]|uniref:Uncharacterized protein n=1 Tax=Hygrophoropsis aurantiaca TaxID=72124 RepID=A0ACB7ZWA3_9AGAM|nr:hypothetical protein BJ138DRAFT_811068 [Hygrophoropsis aurantiaca]